MTNYLQPPAFHVTPEGVGVMAVPPQEYVQKLVLNKTGVVGQVFLEIDRGPVGRDDGSTANAIGKRIDLIPPDGSVVVREPATRFHLREPNGILGRRCNPNAINSEGVPKSGVHFFKVAAIAGRKCQKKAHKQYGGGFHMDYCMKNLNFAQEPLLINWQLTRKTQKHLVTIHA